MYAGGTFDQDAEAKSFVRHPRAGGLDEVRAAAEACPTGAIHLTIGSEGPEGGAA
jgi:ferredoxin